MNLGRLNCHVTYFPSDILSITVSWEYGVDSLTSWMDLSNNDGFCGVFLVGVFPDVGVREPLVGVRGDLTPRGVSPPVAVARRWNAEVGRVGVEADFDESGAVVGGAEFLPLGVTVDVDPVDEASISLKMGQNGNGSKWCSAYMFKFD